MSKRKLLLADDSVTIQKVVNLTFADEGIEVISVGDGDTAIRMITEQPPDVVLADVHMPGLNGYQICERIRQDPAIHELPVVLLVGSFEPFDEGEAERVGANAYLTKPFQSIRQLVTQVTDLIESQTETKEEIVTEFVASPDLPDTGDIDSLYERSFSEPDADETEAAFADEPISDAEEAPPTAYVDAGMDDEMIETFNADEIAKMNDDEAPDHDREFVEDDGEYVQPAVSTSRSPFESTVNEGAAATASAVDTGFDAMAQTEPIHDTSQASTEDFELDEIELLELPPLENGKTIEFTTTQRLRAEGGGKEVVSLSPELIDIIVQKVIEKISEKY